MVGCCVVFVLVNFVLGLMVVFVLYMIFNLVFIVGVKLIGVWVDIRFVNRVVMRVDVVVKSMVSF